MLVQLLEIPISVGLWEHSISWWNPWWTSNKNMNQIGFWSHSGFVCDWQSLVSTRLVTAGNVGIICGCWMQRAHLGMCTEPSARRGGGFTNMFITKQESTAILWLQSLSKRTERLDRQEGWEEKESEKSRRNSRTEEEVLQRAAGILKGTVATEDLCWSRKQWEGRRGRQKLLHPDPNPCTSCCRTKGTKWDP